jgi:hypothetical protein
MCLVLRTFVISDRLAALGAPRFQGQEVGTSTSSTETLSIIEPAQCTRTRTSPEDSHLT